MTYHLNCWLIKKQTEAKAKEKAQTEKELNEGAIA